MTDAQEIFPKRRFRLSLNAWILVGLVAGAAFGLAFPKLALHGEVLKDVFLHLIKVMIGPLVFASIVQGIAGGRDLRLVGRIGVKAAVYFAVVPALALLVGFVFANVLQPGNGVALVVDGALPQGLAGTRPQTVEGIIEHLIPQSFFDALAKGDVLQIVSFSVLFAVAVALAGKAGEPVLKWSESLTQVMFRFCGIVMVFAPVGVAAAMASAIAKQGAAAFFGLGALLVTVYLALAVFVLVVLGGIIFLARVPVRDFLRAVREPCLIGFATTNSESALPKAFEALERLGVPKAVAGFVLPVGYTFNLQGTAVYLPIAVLFVAQASGAAHLGLEQQWFLYFTLLVTSKGVAAVPRASMVVVVAALQAFGLPAEGALLLIGVDALLDMGRTAVNVFGNCLAAVVVARWEPRPALPAIALSQTS